MDLVNQAIERTYAYADAGADGIFIPGLADPSLIEQFVKKSPLPVNIMVMDGMLSNHELQKIGVKRISYTRVVSFRHNIIFRKMPGKRLTPQDFI